MLNNGDGTFQAARKFDAGGGAESLAVADVNGDGKADVLVSVCVGGGDCPSSVGVLLGNGDGTFQPPQVYLGGGSQAPAITVGDLNGDGKIDVLLGNSVVWVLLGNGDGTFQGAESYDPGSIQGVNSIAVGDLNGDHHPDVVVSSPCLVSKFGSNCATGEVGILLGNGDGTFRAAPGHKSGGSHASSIAMADINGDHRFDVAVANECFPHQGGCNGSNFMGGVGVLLNIGPFSTTTTLTSNPNPALQGQAVTLTATVTSVGPNGATGKVTFRNSGVAIGSATLVGGVAVLTKKNLPVGTLSLSAIYGGDTVSGKSTSPVLIQVVNPPNRR